MAAGLGFKDFTTGEVLTAADVDGYLMQGVWVFASAAARTSAVASPQEGNMSFLKDTNSLEYYSGSAWVAVAGGGSTFVGCSVSNTGSQTLTNNTDITLAFNQELYDTNSFHDNVTNNGRITIPSGQGGYYTFNCSVGFQSSTTGNRRLQLFKNGSSTTPTGYAIGKPSGLLAMQFSVVLEAAVGDYFTLVAFQDNGSDIVAEQQGTSFQAIKVG